MFLLRCRLWLGIIFICMSLGLPSVAQTSFLPASNLYVRSVFQDHPISSSIVSAAAMIALWYTYVQVTSKNKDVKVKLVEFNPKNSDAQIRPSYLFAAGIAETHDQAWWYAKKTDDLPYYRYNNLVPALPYTMDGRIFTYDYPDTTSWFWRVNWTQTSLGQWNEVAGFKNAFDQAIAHTHAPQNKYFNLNGMSRGATTILNFMGLHGNKSQYTSRVKSLIVESPFATTKDLAKNMLSKIYLDQVPGMSTLAHSLVSVAFWQHDTAGECAIDAVENIPTDVPIMLVCSKEDTVVPASSTIALYKKLRATGHNKVHIFVADHGIHGRILHDKDGVRYQNVVQAFYKKYGLHHNAQLAELGQVDFDACQP